MLTIRQEQMAVFRAQRIRQFEAHKLSNIKEQFAAWYAQSGEENTIQLIRSGIDKAGGYGLTTRGDVSAYVDLMIRFGPDFDIRQDLEWQTGALRDDGIPAEARMALLTERLAIVPAAN